MEMMKLEPQSVFDFFSKISILKLHFEEKEETVAELQKFIGNTYDYFETERYVFTHGWLPVEKEEDGEEIEEFLPVEDEDLLEKLIEVVQADFEADEAFDDE